MSAGETNQVKERIATLQNATLAYIREGSGVPLLCLHGGMGVDSASLRVPGILKLAERGCDLVVFDQRGHGNSAAAAASAYSNELWATDALQLGRRLGWERMALLGHSYGGFIALEYAVRWAHTLSHLVLVSTSAGPVTTAAPFCLTDREVHDHLQRQWPGFFAGPDKHWDLFEKLRFWFRHTTTHSSANCPSTI
jgi:proline iminopeptidase